MAGKTIRFPRDGPALTKIHSVQAAFAAQESFNKEILNALRGLPFPAGAPRNATGTVAKAGKEDAFLRRDSTTKQGIVAIKGDLLGFSTVPAAVPVGNNGQNLIADSTQALGVRWGAAINFVEVTIALDGQLVYVVTITGQAWVTASSKIVASIFAVANAATTEEMAMASGCIVGAKNRVVGVGFDVWVYSPNGFSGTLTVHCAGV